MLMKRTGSIQKDQQHTCQKPISDDYCAQSHALESNVENNSIFKVPLLFVGLGPKGLLDSDSIRSPTSPLDVTWLSNLGNPSRTPRSSHDEGQQRSWDCTKVGLSIIDSLDDCSKFSGNILLSSECKKTCPCPQMITKTPNCNSCVDFVQASKSLPNDFCKLPYTGTQNASNIYKGKSTVPFEIGESLPKHEPIEKKVCSLESFSPIKDLSGLTGSNFDSDSENCALNQVSSPPHFIGGSQNPNTLPPAELNSNTVSLSSSNEFIKSLSASEIELSEDYTCVISHGPNPKITHIFCDCIMESLANDFKKHDKNDEEKEKALPLQTPNQDPSGGFLSFCHHCNKKLEEGKDIYIYRGEKAFCSFTCRALEIMIDEELEESNPSSENSLMWESGGEIFETGILTAT